MTHQFLIAGFGGQGLLFAGKFMVNKGMLEGKEVTWLPSYGPEMRGGTANCSVIISDEPVGSPIVDHPDVLMVMNRPSLDKYESAVQPGGMIFVDSTLIDRRVERTDVTTFYVPATAMASESGITTLANMILTGKILKELGQFDMADVENALRKVVSAKHPEMYEVNLKALTMGRDYE
ncbi:MAG: 2-oxoacid:acceptor oxidoreductase family protein [Clostridiales bacterium]|nr:2-oxoacid:acceptor oxidoreductase family protein [Clostridiales bacterium]MDD6872691.1 2-oxoacid:acceptor oxidoreductase family protein [Clostridiales bacterium]MDD7366720.1 2-oxoacid:acceptor oxidoreductase family protein [Clostridiales bacterium]MDY2872323.1 2-oxoacid:acceptor oxidoreductase family protein [Eubacteriales bacterium]